MSKERNGASPTTLILKTAGKTAALLCVLLVLICALFLLLAPMRASDFLYSLGWKSFSADMAYTAASRSDGFDDWWSVLVKSVSAENHAKAYEAADRLERHGDFREKIAGKEILVGGVSYGGEYYVAYNKARSGLVYSASASAGIWNYCVDWVEDNGWGEYLGVNFYSVNPVKGYVDALKDYPETEVSLNSALETFDDLYLGEGDYAGILGSSSKRNDFAYTVYSLVKARQGEISAETALLWAERAN